MAKDDNVLYSSSLQKDDVRQYRVKKIYDKIDKGYSKFKDSLSSTLMGGALSLMSTGLGAYVLNNPTEGFANYMQGDEVVSEVLGAVAVGVGVVAGVSAIYNGIKTAKIKKALDGYIEKHREEIDGETTYGDFRPDYIKNMDDKDYDFAKFDRSVKVDKSSPKLDNDGRDK